MIAVIADDITGANDIGIMYAKSNLDTIVYDYKATSYQQSDVIVVDTNSRFDSYEVAYKKVYEAVKTFKDKEVKQYVNKQCSVFRGNIGAEFDAMLDALNEEFAVVVLGFPDNGRTTIHSNHYVHGVLLEESQFKHDPVHPMNKSNLVQILQEQTKRKVGSIHYEIIEQGSEVLKKEINSYKNLVNYVILDVRDNKDLETIAKAVYDEKIICGSSALSKYLAQQYDKTTISTNVLSVENKQNKILCIAGSLTPQTISQISYIKNSGYKTICLNTKLLFRESETATECKRILLEVSKLYETENFVMVHSMNSNEDVNETKQIAKEYGINNTEVSKLVSETLAYLSETIIKQYNINNIIVCGGDTSASLCSALKIKGLRILEEIEAGLPTCQSIDYPYYKMVLKSGSFGTCEFIKKAIDLLLIN